MQLWDSINSVFSLDKKLCTFYWFFPSTRRQVSATLEDKKRNCKNGNFKKFENKKNKLKYWIYRMGTMEVARLAGGCARAGHPRRGLGEGSHRPKAPCATATPNPFISLFFFWIFLSLFHLTPPRKVHMFAKERKTMGKKMPHKYSFQKQLMKLTESVIHIFSASFRT